MNEHTCDLCGQPIATYRSKCPCVSNLIARVRQLEQDADPRTVLAGTEPAGLNAFRDATQRVLDRAVEAGHLGTAVEIPELRVHDEHVFVVAALAIGTRVRVDDRASPMHDREGRVQAYGPGGEIEVVFDGWPGAHGFHRAALALVDDTLPECPGCGGEGSIPLFTGVSDCPACGGSGVVG